MRQVLFAYLLIYIGVVVVVIILKRMFIIRQTHIESNRKNIKKNTIKKQRNPLLLIFKTINLFYALLSKKVLELLILHVSVVVTFIHSFLLFGFFFFFCYWKGNIFQLFKNNWQQNALVEQPRKWTNKWNSIKISNNGGEEKQSVKGNRQRKRERES